MADGISPRDPSSLHVGLKQESDGTQKLVVSLNGQSKEVNCKVVSDNLAGKIQSTFFRMRGWVLVQHRDLRDRQIQAYIQQSDLQALEQAGFGIRHEVAEESSAIREVPESIRRKVREFFQDEKKADEFLENIQMYVGSSKKSLNLDGAFNDQGQCPDIFQDPIFKELRELSLVGISALPNSLRHLKNLENLDLSYSSLVTFSSTISQLSNLKVLNLDYSGINQSRLLAERGRGFGGSSPAEAGARLAVNELFDHLKDLPELKEVGMTSSDPTCLSADILGKKFKEIRKDVAIRSEADIDLEEDLEFPEEVSGVSERDSALSIELEGKIRRFFELDGLEGGRKADLFIAQIENYIRSGRKELVLDGLFNSEGQCPEIFNDPIFSTLQTLSLQGIKNVPHTIGHLGKLANLDLSRSSIVDCFPGIGNLKSLEYLNLAFSGINQVSAVLQFGREYCGGGKSEIFYLKNGHEIAVQNWITQLKRLESLKAVNMAAEDRANSQSASLLKEGLRKTTKVFFVDDPNWNLGSSGE